METLDITGAGDPQALDVRGGPAKGLPAAPGSGSGHGRAPRRSRVARSNRSEAKRGRSRPFLVRLVDVETEEVYWLWHPYIPKGKVTSIEGDPGVGKSWLTTAIAAAVSKGAPLPGQDRPPGPQSVLMLSAEDGLGDTIRPRLEALGANLGNVHALDEPIILDKEGLGRLRQAIEQIQPAVVFIDPLVAYMGGRVDLHRANEMRVLMRALADIAEEYGCAIVTLRHLRKSKGGAAIYQGLGSIDITAACRSVLMVGSVDGASVMAHAKCNLARLGPSFAYDIERGRFRWRGEVRTTAEDLAAEPDDRDTRSAVEEAMEFLKGILGNGPIPSSELREAAKEVGISDRTLKRARGRLRVKASQNGGRWVSSLPPEGHGCQEQKVGPLAS